MEKHITFMYILQPCQLKFLIIASIAEETLKRSQQWIEHFAIIQRFFRAKRSRVTVDESINNGDDVMMMAYYFFFFRACFFPAPSPEMDIKN